MKANHFVYVIAIFLSMLLTTSCEDKGDALTKQLPFGAKEFLKEYLPENRVISVAKTDTTSYEEIVYAITLEGEISMLYGQSGRWYGMSSAKGIPESALKMVDPNVLDKVKNIEPDFKVIRLSPIYYNYSKLIELENGKKYTDGFGNEAYLPGLVVSKDDVPMPVADFLLKHKFYEPIKYDYIIRVTESRGDIYFVLIEDSLALCLNEEGEWIYGRDLRNYDTSETEFDDLRKIAEKELPNSVIAAINSSGQRLGALREVFIYEKGVFGLNFALVQMMVDKDRGIIASPDDAARKFTQLYFTIENVISQQLNMAPYSYGYMYQFNTAGCFFTLNMDIDQKWKSVYCTKMSSGLTHQAALPKKFIENELPAKIMEYISSNYISSELYAVSRNDTQYMVGILNDNIVYFDQEGNFIKELTW